LNDSDTVLGSPKRKSLPVRRVLAKLSTANRAAMEFDEAPHEREPEPQAALGPATTSWKPGLGVSVR
jgi:hypothetical protein